MHFYPADSRLCPGSINHLHVGYLRRQRLSDELGEDRAYSVAQAHRAEHVILISGGEE
jgi:hypothetical protein